MTSLPLSLDAGAGLPGFLVGIVIMSIGLGGVKSGVSPLMGPLSHIFPSGTDH